MKAVSNSVPENALFVCFGGMSNVGTLTGLAALQAVKEVGPDKAGIFCLGGLPTGAPNVLDKAIKVKRIITVDGCTLNCARKIAEGAGFTPTVAINLVQDCGIQKGPPSAYGEEDLQAVAAHIVSVVRAG